MFEIKVKVKVKVMLFWLTFVVSTFCDVTN